MVVRKPCLAVINMLKQNHEAHACIHVCNQRTENDQESIILGPETLLTRICFINRTRALSCYYNNIEATLHLILQAKVANVTVFPLYD